MFRQSNFPDSLTTTSNEETCIQDFVYKNHRHSLNHRASSTETPSWGNESVRHALIVI